MIESPERHQIVPAEYRFGRPSFREQSPGGFPPASIIRTAAAPERHRVAVRLGDFRERAFALGEARAWPRRVDHRKAGCSAAPQDLESLTGATAVIAAHPVDFRLCSVDQDHR